MHGFELMWYQPKKRTDLCSPECISNKYSHHILLEMMKMHETCYEMKTLPLENAHVLSSTCHQTLKTILEKGVLKEHLGSRIFYEKFVGERYDITIK
jgi:hypothetical protein